MNRLANLIEQLDVQDLKLIQKDLEAGNIERLVKRRLNILDEKQRKTCATCGRELAPSEQKYSLEFGPRDLRQKAWFDELDCLDHFLENQRSIGSAVRPARSSQGAQHLLDSGEALR
jgi:hypothetical protein